MSVLTSAGGNAVDFSLHELQVFLLSMVPLGELRISIPYGIYMGLTPLKAFFIACFGNFIPIIPLLFLLNPISNIINKIPKINKLYQSFLMKTRKKSAKVDKYGAIGLMLLVAVPLPGTGIYSGAVLAFLLGIRFRYALTALTLGMIIAGIAVTLASSGAKQLSSLIYNFEYILIGLFFVSVIIWFIRKR